MLTALIRLLSRLPLSVLHSWGAILGRLVVAVSPGYRRHLIDNLAQAGFDPTRDRQLARTAAEQAGKGALELAWVWMRPQAQVLARTTATGWAAVQSARAAGKGIVFLTPHLGCFEVTAQILANDEAAGAPLTVLYRPPRKAWLAPLIEGSRARQNLKLAPADISGVRRLARALKRGEAIGLLPDQVPRRGEGVWAPFFGKPAYTMTLPARLQRLTDAAIVLTYGERLDHARGWVVHFEHLDVTLSDDATVAATQINAAMEGLIRRLPAQYLWGYNRYKGPRSAGAPGASDPETRAA